MHLVRGCFPLIDQATQEYIQDLIYTYQEAGYDYYLVYSVYYRDSWSSRPDYYIVFSHDAITTSDGYTYVVPDDRVSLGLYRSPDDSEYAVNAVTVSDRITVGKGVFAYTNSTNTGTVMMPDIIADRGVSHEAFLGVSLCLGVVIVVLLVNRLWRWFGVG